MRLSIELVKKSQKSSILRCTREDGSITFAKLYPTLEIHDIAHYVVEQQLRFSNAFYGLLGKGYDIADFSLPRDTRPTALLPKNLPEEALVTEHLVNLLQTAYFQPTPIADILDNLAQILLEKQLQFPRKITQKTLHEMTNALKSFMRQWTLLENDEKLLLQFEV